MRRLATVLLTPACLAACTSAVPPPPAAQDSSASLAISAVAHAAFDRYAALAPQTADAPTARQAEFFTDIEHLLRYAREAKADWNRDLFFRAALDQYWRGGFEQSTIEKLGLTAPEDAIVFRAMVARILDTLDPSNTAFLKAEVDRRGGWPPESDIGEGAAHFAWLLVQHADRDPAFQERVLALMEPMVAAGEADGADFAYLFDRVARAANRPQRFGTQGNCVTGENRWTPFEMEDPGLIDERRAAVHLQPMADYIAIFKERRLCEGQ